ncbi:MAG: 1-deoxy-D-xylulose-5-phosphate synthase [Lentisphaerae bacterium]|nr:1-deoxy-D-xylulose-5-phosphate synthase [Lentisphaerota bacterium]
MNRILDSVNTPADLRTLSLEDLTQLSGEIRELIIQTVSRTGGHLAANLGTVELTIALLKVFDPPADKLVWDVSHQTYTWKILTGRKKRFATLRQLNGLSGFATKAESPYDAFGAGHAGTALSAALGMAVARDRLNGAEHVIAIVGDGALSCGSSFEALNNLSSATRRLIVILNDNEMSISANVGSIAGYLGKLLANPRYNRWKSSVERFAKDRLRLTWLRHMYFRLEEALKSLFLRNVLFEEFGLRYIGPIDGHNMRTLISALETARRSDEPILLHVFTQKGKGYSFAEEEPEAWHGTEAFEAVTGQALKPSRALKYAEVFGQTMERLAETNDKLVAITAAMAVGTGLTSFAQRYPERFFDVGICEEHAVVFAAGLAAQGWRPVMAVYSTFAQRIVDYVIHDVCLQQLPVIFCLDRAGLVGDDGPTHHGMFDIALFRSAPNLVFLQPKDEAELANMLYSALRWPRPVMIRYPRGAGPGAPLGAVNEEIPLGRAQVLQEGREIQIWALGDMIPLATKVAQLLALQGRQVGIVNPRFIVPLDRDLLNRQAAVARCIATLENGVVTGGFGSCVIEALAETGYAGAGLRFGWPGEFIPQGPFDALAERFGLTAPAIAAKISSVLK